MNSKFYRECLKKKRYPTMEKAQKVANLIKETRGVENLHAYYCPHCGGYHLTSKPDYQGPNTRVF